MTVPPLENKILKDKEKGKASLTDLKKGKKDGGQLRLQGRAMDFSHFLPLPFFFLVILIGL